MNAQNHATAALPLTPLDGLSLGAHVQACDRARGRAFMLHVVGERLHAVLGPRLFTTVFAATALMSLLAGCA